MLYLQAKASCKTMKPYIHKIRHKARKHRTFLLTILVILLLGLIVNFLNGAYTQKIVINSFQKSYEKQAVTQLDAYNFGLQALLQSRLTNQLDTLNRLVNEPATQAAILSKNYGSVEEKFKNLINTDKRFDIVYIFDQKGIARLGVNKENDTKVVGSDFSFRDYFKVPASTKQPYIGYAFHTARNNDVIPFSVPVINPQGDVIAVVSAASILSNLASYAVLPHDLPGLYSSVVDSEGNLIMSAGKAPTQITNIKDKDRLILALIGGESNTVKSEINYLNDKVFAEGSVISVGGNKFFVANYYLQSRYDHDLAVVKSDYRRSLFTSRMRSLAIFLVGSIIVFWIIKHHEEVSDE